VEFCGSSSVDGILFHVAAIMTTFYNMLRRLPSQIDEGFPVVLWESMAEHEAKAEKSTYQTLKIQRQSPRNATCECQRECSVSRLQRERTIKPNLFSVV
jgi:hypothetical protein